MASTDKLCLGTAQFGNSYGITNKNEIIETNSAERIIREAFEKGINYLDTAQAYGKAEEIIGKCAKYNQNLKIISKLKKIEISQGSKDLCKILEKEFFESLIKLRSQYIDTYLVHNVKDLFSEEGEVLINWLLSIKKRGLVKNIGVSLYDPLEITQEILKNFDVIQLPLSIYDQRFLQKNLFEIIKKYKIEIHIRSIFLQGLILENSSNWPKTVSRDFKKHHENLEINLKKNNLTLIDAAVEFIKNIENTDLILFGITSIKELNLFISKWKDGEKNNFFDNNIKWDWNSINDIDPRKW